MAGRTANEINLSNLCGDAGVTHPTLRGALFENWVVSEVLKWRLHRGLPQRMFHLRHAKGLEIDLVVEEGNRLTAT